MIGFYWLFFVILALNPESTLRFDNVCRRMEIGGASDELQRAYVKISTTFQGDGEFLVPHGRLHRMRE